MTTSLPESLADAVEMLAKRAVVMREIRAIQKQAFGIDMSQLGGQALDLIKKNPRIAGSLLGAAGGGLLGGLSSLRQPEEDRNMGGSALTGALAGAGLGFGAGHFLGGAYPTTETSKKLEEVNQKADEVKKKYLDNPPTAAGSLARTAPIVGATGAADVAQQRFRTRAEPEDIFRGATSAGGSGTRQSRTALRNLWGRTDDATHRDLMRHAMGHTGQGRASRAMEWLRNLEIRGRHPFQNVLPNFAPPDVPRGSPAATNPVALQNWLREGRDARVAPLRLRGRDFLGRGLLYAGIPIADYLIRKSMHDINPPL